MTENDAARGDLTGADDAEGRGDITHVLSPDAVDAAVTQGSGISGPDYGAAGGVDELQTVASDFTGNINSEPGDDATGIPEGEEHT